MPLPENPIHTPVSAWAGEPKGRYGCSRGYGVYPRVGGGTRESWKCQTFQPGLSPRGRGNHHLLSPSQSTTGVYPRVGGGTACGEKMHCVEDGLSPRGRGNRQGSNRIAWYSRSIPAWAGEPCASWPATNPTRVYPRVGGGTLVNANLHQQLEGLSPRGRGNHTHTNVNGVLCGSIPAWAGEPHPHQR